MTTEETVTINAIIPKSNTDSTDSTDKSKDSPGKVTIKHTAHERENANVTAGKKKSIMFYLAIIAGAGISIIIGLIFVKRFSQKKKAVAAGENC